MVADRAGGARVATITQLVRVVTMAAAAITFAALSPGIWWLGAVAVIFGLADAFYLPAASSLPKRIVDEQTLPSAQGAVQTVQRACTIVSGPLAGVFMATGGTVLVCLFNCVVFSASLWAFRHIDSTPPTTDHHPADSSATASFLTETRAGLAYIARHPTLRWIVPAVTALNVALAAPLNVGLALLSTRHDWGASGLGLLYAAFGASAFLGSAAVALRRWRRPTTLGLTTMVLASMFIGLLGSASRLPLAALALVGVGATLGPAGALLVGDIQRMTQEAFIGRVTSVLTLGSLGLAPLTYGAFGLLVDASGTAPAFWLCGAVAGLTAAIAGIALQSKQRRTATRSPAPTPEPMSMESRVRHLGPCVLARDALRDSTARKRRP